jgi:hypothetical protein
VTSDSQEENVVTSDSQEENDVTSDSQEENVVTSDSQEENDVISDSQEENDVISDQGSGISDGSVNLRIGNCRRTLEEVEVASLVRLRHVQCVQTAEAARILDLRRRPFPPPS